MAWIAAGWVWRYVARETAPMLREGTDIRRHLEMAEKASWVDRLVLEDYSESEISAFHDAVRVVEQKTLAAGPSVMHDPSFYDGLCARLQDLRRMLDGSVPDSDRRGEEP